MKKLILILFLVLLSANVYARVLDIDDIRFYQNGERITDVAFSGNIDEINKGDKITVKVDMTNTINETIKDIIVFSEIKNINDGSDEEEETSEFDLDSNDDIRKELELQIPNDADYGEYDMYIKIRSTITNNTEELAFFNYTLSIMKKPIDVDSILLDINNSLTVIEARVKHGFVNTTSIDELNRKVDAITTQKDKEITDLKNQISPKDTEITNLKTSEKSFSNEVDRLNNIVIPNLRMSYENNITNTAMYYQSLLSKSSTNNMWTIMFIIAIAVIGGLMLKKKFFPNVRLGGQKPPNVEGRFPLKY